MNKTPKILVVDDEPQLLRVLRRSLTAHRFDVRSASEGDAALEVFNDWSPDLVITDLSMPVMDGLTLCRELRRVSRVPIIVLSVKGEERTKVEALDAGADDYVTKPFGIDELLARVRAALRRAPEEDPEHGILTAGDFELDKAAYRISVRGKEVHLTPKEFELLSFLIENRGRVLTHRTLLAAVWGGDYVLQSEYLRVFIGNLRKKIEVDPSNPKHITTEPWVGYRFDPSS
ncbi:MAG: response regulator transcription factor [Aridibacter famidurans]|nr:response regulator transcription factor [Aridibacter famidurans]